MPKKDKLALYIFIDALGWEVIKERPFLNDLARTKEPLGTIFGYSSSCDPSILTGKLPQEHEHFSFFRYNPKDSPFAICKWLDFLPKSLTRRGRVRQLMSRFIGKFYGITGYFQIYNMPFKHLSLFDHTEKRDIYKPGGINSGASIIFEYLEARGIPFHASNWRLPEIQRIEALEADLPKREIEFAYLFLGDIDAVMHEHGTQGPEVDSSVSWYDKRLRQTLDLVNQNYDDVEFYVFSDHGMTNTIDNCDLISRINALGFTFGKDYAAVYDSTMARFWFFNENARKSIAEALGEEPRGKILDQATLADYGCDFKDDLYGELFFLLDPGVLLCPSFMGETTLKGMHGFDPYDKDSLASLTSNQKLADPPKRLEEMYDLMKASADRLRPETS
ncbi:MAG: hypothetical protein GWQ05_00975 [Verrucomicrobiaceae bacterium]|jgi:predicted AlkP superfamily pyrophosphatase or phosphodiesterase|nr:hypothetical protein [Verrucomicrobiaceae bacterium]NCF89524.1 hypothetical protein [Verrucomicrobiaceae bacterium]